MAPTEVLAATGSGPVTAPQQSPDIVQVTPLAADLARIGLTWLDRLKSLTVAFTDEFKARVNGLVTSAGAVVIRDQASYDAAAELTRNIKRLRAEAEENCRPVTAAFHAAHRASTTALNEVDKPLAEAEALLKRRLYAWDQEQQRKQAEAEARARVEAERIRRELEAAERQAAERVAAENRAREEAERLEVAVQAEAEGATAAEVEHLLATPVIAPEPFFDIAPPPPPPLPLPVAAPTYQRAAGISKPRENWKAAPALNARSMPITPEQAKQKLIEAAAKEPRLAAYLDINQSALDRIAKAEKHLFSIPGFRAFNDPNISVRR
jgi:hypothetical protein